MASGDVLSLLENCVKKLHANTAQPENFLSFQDEVAADFTSLTKTLYDLQKTYEPVCYKGSPLTELVVENFDQEQIWQELELQNSAVLKHFKSTVDQALSDETLTILEEDEEEDERDTDGKDFAEEEEEEEEEEDEEKEEKRHRHTKKKPVETEEFTDEDSDLDFDVDALEKREQRKKESKKLVSKTKIIPSEIDDKFFKLSEMEGFLDDMDKQEGKKVEDEDGVNYFHDLPSGDDEDIGLDEILSTKKLKKNTKKSSRNLKYKDFFDAVDTEPAEADEESDGEAGGMDESQEESEEQIDDEDDDNNGTRPLKVSSKKVTFQLSGDEESEGEDMEEIFGGKSSTAANVESKSSFEKRQEKMSQTIREMEKAALTEKPWQLSGEVTAQTRPENSMLEEDVEFEQTFRTAPAITEETTLQLEEMIKQRIRDNAFDDVVRKEKPKESVFEYKKRLTLDHEKSKQSLAEVYEQEFIKQTQQKTEEEKNPAHVEIEKLMDSLFLKLDALSNFHFTPKPAAPEVKVVSNLPSIAMEEVAPVSVSDATLLAPEEIKEKNRAGDIVGSTEKTSTDKKRERRLKRKAKRLKIKEKEKRQKLKETSKSGQNKKPSQAEIRENLKKLTKGGKATLIKDEGKDKALRSSQAFFSQLQDQVKSQIKSAKNQSSKKKKKQKEVSVTKLKL
ncbi:U3 small nucleolar ribonucleoprotein MPP10 isoform X2 [Cynoglossus semilaevis]|uniref:U3 small nucleolar ribonucleoprotein MPP10 isoform X2 n=1 Tax=Cynoglossus semilaevis TaxID=244447 RepID=UPI000D62875E|nr:U3 small nucleolar ribonucleoprotein protein MPP10 isoform X2 [Cynoglossus semilaevis]